jgi:hypothetical protein
MSKSPKRQNSYHMKCEQIIETKLN